MSRFPFFFSSSLKMSSLVIDFRKLVIEANHAIIKKQILIVIIIIELCCKSLSFDLSCLHLWKIWSLPKLPYWTLVAFEMNLNWIESSRHFLAWCAFVDVFIDAKEFTFDKSAFVKYLVTWIILPSQSNVSPRTAKKNVTQWAATRDTTCEQRSLRQALPSKAKKQDFFAENTVFCKKRFPKTNLKKKFDFNANCFLSKD